MSEEAAFLDKVIGTFGPHANDSSYSAQQWPGAIDAADAAIALLDAKPPAKILDLACGCGAATAAMALRGFDVTGIDCTPASVEIARRAAGQREANVEWLCQDMRTIGYKEAFDYVCLRDVIFGIFEAPGEDSDLLGRIAASLRPGGKCLLEVYNKEFSLRHGVQNCLFYDAGVDRFVGQGAARNGISVRLYSPHQWQQMLAQHDLTIVRLGGWNWPNDPPPPPWRADFIVAQKRASAT